MPRTTSQVHPMSYKNYPTRPNVVYDRKLGTFTLEDGELLQWVPSIEMMKGILRKRYGMELTQAREVVLQSVFNDGVPIYIDIFRKIASSKKVYEFCQGG